MPTSRHGHRVGAGRNVGRNELYQPGAWTMSSTRRPSKTIGFKAFQDTDQDILEWWEGLPEGQRSQVLRDLIRSAMADQGISSEWNGHKADGQQLAQVGEDTAWIRS